MTEECGCTLKIDEEFRRLIFPYSQKEYAALEQRILQEGCRQPVPGEYFLLRRFLRRAGAVLPESVSEKGN